MNVVQEDLQRTTIFVSTTLIEGIHSVWRMYDRGSCKACGTHLTPSAICNICKEYVSWVCGKCYKIDDVTHSHNYCRVSYKPQVVIKKNKSSYTGSWYSIRKEWTLLNEDIVGLFQETVEDTLSEIPSIVALLRIKRYDLDQTVTNELDFILGAVFSQIINRFKIYSTNRSMKISENDLNELYLLLFSKAEEFKNLILKSTNVS